MKRNADQWSRRRFLSFIAVSRVEISMRPCSSTPASTGESCGRPSRRMVASTAWWFARTKERASQLTLRTNQFNFTTRRREEGEVQALLTEGAYEIRTVRVRDRFGDYGLVGHGEQRQHLGDYVERGREVRRGTVLRRQQRVGHDPGQQLA